MPLIQYTLIEVGVELGILTQHKKRSLSIITAQRGEYPLRNTGRWSVVKGEEYSVTIVYLPNKVGIESFYKTPRLNFHSFNYLSTLKTFLSNKSNAFLSILGYIFCVN
jgi:hypothetical protein